MKDEQLQDFMLKLIINEKIAIYKNEAEGLRDPITLAHLLCRVDYLELDDKELKVSKFKNIIEDKDYKMYDCEKLVPKSEITKNEEDTFTLTKKKYKGAKVWNVSNQLGIHTTYENQKEAFKLCEEINEKVILLSVGNPNLVTIIFT